MSHGRIAELGKYFDVVMGSYDGAELWEFIGIYIQSFLVRVLEKDQMGLYQDDRLIIIRYNQQTEQI